MITVIKMKIHTIALFFIYCCLWGLPVQVAADPELPLLGENASVNLKKEIELGSSFLMSVDKQY